MSAFFIVALMGNLRFSFIFLAAVIAAIVFAFVSIVRRVGGSREKCQRSRSRLGWTIAGLLFLAGSVVASIGTIRSVETRQASFVSPIATVETWIPEPVGHFPQAELSNVSVVSNAEKNAPSAWDENMPLVANVYPGIAECGRPLAQQIVNYLKNNFRSEEGGPKAEMEEPAKYRIALKNSGLDQRDYLNFLINFRGKFTSDFPSSFVDDMTARDYPKPKDKEKERQFKRLYVTVYYSSDGKGGVAKWDLRRSNKAIERSGQMVCTLRHPDAMGQVEFSSDFVDKPWVADVEKFVSLHPKEKYIVGFSTRLATSEQEARVGALNDASRRLLKSRKKTFAPNYDRERNVVDRFVQKLTMPYGSVWREAVLIDYGKAGTNFHSLCGNATDVKKALRNPKVSGASTKNSAAAALPKVPKKIVLPSTERLVAGLMMLTIVVGWVSNWMTQGYYRRPVWTVAGTLFTVGFFVLLATVLLTVA